MLRADFVLHQAQSFFSRGHILAPGWKHTTDREEYVQSKYVKDEGNLSVPKEHAYCQANWFETAHTNTSDLRRDKRRVG